LVADFATLQKKTLQGYKNTCWKGGELIFFQQEKMVPEFGEEAANQARRSKRLWTGEIWIWLPYHKKKKWIKKKKNLKIGSLEEER